MRRYYCLAWIWALLLTAVPAFAQQGQAASSGSLSSTGAVTLDVRGMGTASITVSGTYSGTISFEVQGDPGASAIAVNCAAPNSTSTVTSTTSTGVWVCPVAGLTLLQARMSSYTSGTASVYLRASAGGGASGGGGGGAAGSVTINDPTTTSQKLAISVSGHAQVDCSNCTGSGASNSGAGAYTQGTDSFAPAGGFAGTYSAVTSGRAGIFQMTTDGALYSNLYKVGGTAITLGSKTSSASIPVVIASDQGTIATAANQTTGNTSLASIDTSNSRLTSSAEGISPGTVGATTSFMVGGIYNSTPPTFTTGQRGAIQLDANGNQKVNCTNCSGSGVSVNEDVAALNADPGTPAYAVRSDAPTGTTSADGDYTPLKSDSIGRMWVHPSFLDSGAADMTDATNHALKVNIVAGAGSGGTALADGGAFTAGTTSATPLSGFYQSSPTTCTTGTACAVGLTTNREVKAAITTIKDSGGTDITDTTNHALKVSVQNGSTTDTEDASIASGQSSLALTVPLQYLYNGSAWVRPTSDPCMTETKVYTAISQAASAQLVTGTASKKVYVCGITIVGADAENVSLVSGTGTVCATGTAAMVGGTTAANGANLAANGGFVLNNGQVAWTAAGTAADNVCLLQSGTGRVSGLMVSVVR